MHLQCRRFAFPHDRDGITFQMPRLIVFIVSLINNELKSFEMNIERF